MRRICYPPRAREARWFVGQNAGETFNCYTVRSLSENEAAVAGAAGNALTVEVFEQRDGIFARDA